MNVFLLILSGFILLILLLLFCPFVVKIRFEDKVKLKVGYFFPVFSINIGADEETDPVKRKKQEKKKQRKAEKKKRKAEKKKQKQNKDGEENPEEKKGSSFINKIKSRGLSGIIELLKELVRILTYLLGKITEHLVISRMDLQLNIGTEDAAKTATTCGYASAAIFPLIAFIEQHVKKCRHREQIIPMFTQTETKVHFLMKARIMPFFVISAALGTLIRTLKALAK